MNNPDNNQPAPPGIIFPNAPIPNVLIAFNVFLVRYTLKFPELILPSILFTPLDLGTFNTGIA